jgi:hypothetical protein
MNIKDLSLLSLVAAMTLSTACVVDDDDAGGDTDTDTNATTMTATDPTNMTDPTPGTSTTNSTDPDTTSTETDSGPDTDTDGDTDGDTDTDTDGEDGFNFRDDDPSAYTQVDRKGFPAVNTALIASENKDAYNQASPTNDVAGDFAGDIVASLDFLHIGNGDGDGLDDELAIAAPAIGNPDLCIPPSAPNDNCVQQGGPFVFPDVVRINTNDAAVFPNGRDLATPVVDVILAVLLLDVLDNAGDFNGAQGAFVDLDMATDGFQGLSQSGNDVEFSASFPYLGAAHE